MKKLILTLCFLIVTIILTAAPIDMRTAQTVARNFWIANGGNSNVEWVDMTSQTPFTEFYIFGNANNEGFVIVSADDCVIPVLGYSLVNAFNSKMPAHIADYLDGMDREIAYCKAQNFPFNSELANRWSSLIDGSYTPQNTTAVTPLLTTTWNQSPRYNNLCPGTGSNQAVTGCVATAMAQVMKFWNWPARGAGSHSYTHYNYGTLFADFGATTYQWSLMPNALTSSSTSTQINAVATLMYHVGVALEMDYDPDGSGAYTHDYNSTTLPCPKNTLPRYFNYKSTLHSVYRDNVSNSTWVNTIKNELDAGRPVMHSGSDTSGGHSFVCDGYDNNNLFHFNWGWGGSCDGYYAIDNLSPQSGGTGGNATYTFNLNRGVVVGIEPDKSVHANTNVLYYPQEGGLQSFTITFNNNTSNHWYVTSSQSWLTVSPTNGAGSGSSMANINATASVNNTGSARTAVITLTQGSETFNINVIQNECSNSDMCAISLVMNDTYGDGWNGASVSAYSASGYLYGTYTLTEGSYSTETIYVCPSSLVLTWSSGSYDDECSFTIKNAAGTTIFTVNDTYAGSWNVSNPCNSSPSTGCTVTTFPWTESFEGSLDCWQVNDVDGDGYNWFIATGAPHTGTHSMASYSYLNDNGQALYSNNYLISPAITLPSSGNYTLSFYVESGNTNYPDSLMVKLSTASNPTPNQFTTTLMSKTLIGSTNYQQYTLNLNNYRGQTFHIAFVHKSYNGSYISLDDVSILNTNQSYTITVNSSNNAMGSATGSGTFSSGATDTLFATANSSYRFTGWNDGNTENPRAITVIGNATYTAYFSDLGSNVLQYDNGTFVQNLGAGGELYWGVCFPASELTGYTQLSAVRIMDNYSGTYQLSVYQGGTSAPGNLLQTQTLTLSGTGDWYEYTLLSPVTLNSSQNLWIVFYSNNVTYPAAATNYTGNVNGSWMSMDGSTWSSTISRGYYYTWMIRAVLAQGTPQTNYTITVNSSNNTMGSASGGGSYSVGATATLTATANNGYRFTGWNDGNTENPREITVTGNATYTANFSNLGSNVLQYDNGTYATTMGAGGDIYWAVCFPASSLTGYTNLSAIRIYDYAAGNYSVSVYQGGVYSPGTLIETASINLSGAESWYESTFNAPITLNTSLNLWIVVHNNDTQYPAAAANYAGNPNGSWVSLDGSSWSSICDYDYNYTWMLRAVLSNGSTPQNYTITVNSANPSMGSVSGGGTYQEGTQISISANAANHYHFTQWNDGSTQNPRTITVTGNATYTAYFAPDQYQITVTSGNSTMGYVLGGGVFDYGTSISISAIPYPDHEFTSWNDGNTNNPRNIVVFGPASYIANFQTAIGIDDWDKEDILVFSTDRQIHVKNAGGMAVEIYDMTGRLIVLERANDKSEKSFFMNATGVYLVKVGDHFKQKIIIAK